MGAVLKTHESQETHALTEEGAKILAAAQAIAPLARDLANETETLRTMPSILVDAMRKAGIFRMSVPRSLGGPELPPARQFEIIEAVSIGDGSAGWCAYIGSNSGHFTAYLDDDVTKTIYSSVDSNIDLIMGGVPTPIGSAEVAEGGYIISGRWPFGSGVKHSDWMLAGALVRKDGRVVCGSDGKPTVIAAFMAADQINVIDNWNSTGLRGTGSHDYEVHGVFVPKERTFNFYSSPVRRTGGLYGFPNTFFFNHAAVALGVARSAIEAFRELTLEKKTPWGPLKQLDFARAALAQAEAAVRSSRSFCLDTLEDFFATLNRGDKLSLEQLALYRLAITHAHHSAVKAVDLVFNAAGTTSVKVPGVLDRCFRDVHTANQHLVASPMSYAITGGMFLGEIPIDPLYFPPSHNVDAKKA